VASAWAIARGGVVECQVEDKESVYHQMGRARKRTTMDQARILYREAEVKGVCVESKAMAYSH